MSMIKNIWPSLFTLLAAAMVASTPAAAQQKRLTSSCS